MANFRRRARRQGTPYARGAPNTPLSLRSETREGDIITALTDAGVSEHFVPWLIAHHSIPFHPEVEVMVSTLRETIIRRCLAGNVNYHEAELDIQRVLTEIGEHRNGECDECCDLIAVELMVSCVLDEFVRRSWMPLPLPVHPLPPHAIKLPAVVVDLLEDAVLVPPAPAMNAGGAPAQPQPVVHDNAVESM